MSPGSSQKKSLSSGAKPTAPDNQKKAVKMPDLEVYTAKELEKTARMMELLRLPFEMAVPGRPIRLKKWWGAGAVAGALLERHLGNSGTLAPSSATSKRP
jgi:hypothetical protein